MSEHHQPNHEVKSIEAALRSLTTAPAQLNRDELMYQAGWSAALDESKSNVTVRANQPAQRHKRHWFFPALSMVATTAAVVFFALLMTQQGQNSEGNVTDNSVPDRVNESSSETLIAQKAGIESMIREKVRQERMRNVTKTVYGSALKSGSTLLGPGNNAVANRSVTSNSSQAKSHVGLMNELIQRRAVSFGN